jgi:glycosyltransferase involved in cell wall biosynthesis
MKISIVIPAYNEEAALGPCIEHALRSVRYSGLAKGEAEIIVVNNASSDNTESVARRYEGVLVINEPRKGLPRARQSGFEAAQGELLAQADADTRMSEAWVRKVVDAFERDPDMVAYSGPYWYFDAPLPARYFMGFMSLLEYCAYLFFRYVMRVGNGLYGGNLAVRRDALENIGGYNLNLNFYGEDGDLGQRLYPLGKVVSSLRLWMPASARRYLVDGFFSSIWRYSRNALAMALTHKPVDSAHHDVRLPKTP